MIKGRAAGLVAVFLLVIAIVAGGLSAYQAYSARLNPNFEGLEDLQSVEEFATSFNIEQGKPRLVLLMSPTCPVCVAGANWVEKNILDAYPEADISVLAVWFNMYPGDQKNEWDPIIIDDPRVSHYWNEGRHLGKWYASEGVYTRFGGQIAWDMFILYGPDTIWEDGTQSIVSSGATIIREKDLLFDSLLPYLESEESGL
jgi:hypothetical protein